MKPDATERKTLVICTFVAGVICLFPMEWVSGIALLVLSGVFYVLDLRVTAREEGEGERAPAHESDAPSAEPG